jgi:hypothetical protein
MKIKKKKKKTINPTVFKEEGVVEDMVGGITFGPKGRISPLAVSL